MKTDRLLETALLFDAEAEEYARKADLRHRIEAVVAAEVGRDRCVTVLDCGGACVVLVCRWYGFSRAEDNGWGLFAVRVTRQEDLPEALRLLARAAEVVVKGKVGSGAELN